MTDKKPSLYEKILADPETQKILEKLPKEDHGLLLESVKNLMDSFEQKMQIPLENLKEHLKKLEETRKQRGR